MSMFLKHPQTNDASGKSAKSDTWYDYMIWRATVKSLVRCPSLATQPESSQWTSIALDKSHCEIVPIQGRL